VVKFAFKFLISKNIFVAFATLSLYLITDILYHINDPLIGGFVFFSTLFAYNYMRFPLFFSKTTFCKIGLVHCVVILFSGLISCFLMFFLGLKFILLIIPIILISVLYPLSIDVNKKAYSIRSIPFLKLFLISFVWAYVTVFLPLIYNSVEINIYVLSVFVQRVLFVIAIAIPFDIRDINVDRIKTLPNTLGTRASKFFACACLLLVELLLIINVIASFMDTHHFIAIFLSILLSAIIISLTHKNNSYFFYGIFVEGLSIIMCLFVIISNWIY